MADKEVRKMNEDEVKEMLEERNAAARRIYGVHVGKRISPTEYETIRQKEGFLAAQWATWEEVASAYGGKLSSGASLPEDVEQAVEPARSWVRKKVGLD